MLKHTYDLKNILKKMLLLKYKRLKKSKKNKNPILLLIKYCINTLLSSLFLFSQKKLKF